MATTHTIYIEKKANADQMHTLRFSTDSAMPDYRYQDSDFDWQIKVGVIQKSSDGAARQFQINELETQFLELTHALEMAKPGDCISVAGDVLGNYYDASDPLAVFTDWNRLTRQVKAELSWRSERQMDPFRQSLLDSLLMLPCDQILDVFQHGIESRSTRLMALAVQALPEEVLDNDDLASALLADMTEAFRCYRENLSADVKRTAIGEYPLFYALAKLRFSRHDCHQEAWADTVKDYSQYHDEKVAANIYVDAPYFCDEGEIPFVIAQAEYLLEQGNHYLAGVTLMGADLGMNERIENDANNQLRDHSVDSLTYGYALADEFIEFEFASIASILVDEEVLLELISEQITCHREEMITSLEDIYYAIEDCNPYLLLEKMNVTADDADLLESSVFDQVISSSIIENRFDEDVLLAMAKMHVKYFGSLDKSFDENYISAMVNNKMLKEYYSLGLTINAMFYECYINLTLENEITTKITLSELINTVIHAINPSYDNVDSRDRSSALFATTCLALTGTDNEMIIKKMDTESLNIFLDIAGKNNIDIDNKVMIKINRKSKTKLLENDLGL